MKVMMQPKPLIQEVKKTLQTPWDASSVSISTDSLGFTSARPRTICLALACGAYQGRLPDSEGRPLTAPGCTPGFRGLLGTFGTFVDKV